MISVVLATYNEEKNIVRCLEAVQEFADQIVVVDGSSTDNTVELARKFTDEIIRTTNKPVFHINKQMAMDRAKGELIIQLDADEVIDDQLKNFIIQTHHSILNGEKDKIPSAWWVKRKNYFLGRFLKKGGQYPDPVIRIYQKGKARLPQKDVHEQMEVDGEVGWATGHLLHYGTPSFADYIRKWNDYTSLKATQLDEQKIKINFLNTLIYFMYKPIITFLSLYVRHKGCMDGYPGFIFAIYSGLYHPVSYLKLWELRQKKQLH